MWMRRARGTAGQSTAEYAIGIAFVLAALVGMQVYIKRGLQAKYKDTADTLTQAISDQGGSIGGLNKLQQYEPYYAHSTADVTQDRKNTEGLQEGGGFTKQSAGFLEKTTRAAVTQEQGTDLAADSAWTE